MAISSLKPLAGEFVDGESKPVDVDVVYGVRGDALIEIMTGLRRQYGDALCLLPLSGQSGGSGVFQAPRPQDGIVVGLKIQSTPSPRTRQGKEEQLATLALDEIVIDTDSQCACAGAAVTLEQLNDAVVDIAGTGFGVPGADLTSYTYAQVGATFMTGGMGPQRRYFSDSVIEIALHDGEKVISISAEVLRGYAGTYGWSGLVTAVRCQYTRFPDNEIAIALPILNSPASVARLIDSLGRFCNVEIHNGRLVCADGGSNLVLGIEHVTTGSMAPLLATQGDTAITRRASVLAKKCQAAEVDGLVFVLARSNDSPEDFIISLVDEPAMESPRLAGVDLEHSELFDDPDEMRAVREAIPFAARTQVPGSRFVFKGHTDATIRLAANRHYESMEKLWACNQQYVSGVRDCLAGAEGVDGELLEYGHLNPAGVDPHNRLTYWSDDEGAFTRVSDNIAVCLHRYMKQLIALCDSTGSEFVGGEKSAASDRELVEVLGSDSALPDLLANRMRKQIQVVCCASRMFNWRALPPFR